MKILYSIAIALLLVCCCSHSYSQGSTSMGTEFWTAYMANTNPPNTPDGSVMDLYITSDVNTSGTVDFENGTTSAAFTVFANKVTIITVPPNAYLANAGKFHNAIHILSLKPVAVYAHIFAQNSSGATLLLPVSAMGKNYYSINYTQHANEVAYSAFIIIATEDNTTVQVTPTATLYGTNTAATPFQVTLDKGDVYQGLSSNDLTGTTIQSVSSGTNACKPIAVFSGSTRIEIGCNQSDNSSDNLFQQVYPTASWGKDYVTVPLKNRDYDIFRIILSNPNSNVTLNGTAIPQNKFINGLYYQFNSAAPNTISSDQPIQVVQYAVSQGNTLACGNDSLDIGDPEMIYLTPLEQTLDHVTLFSTSNYMILQSYINVLMKSSAVSSFILDGQHYSNFATVPNNTQYSYAQISVNNGAHNITAGDGFSAIAYGFGQHESYGYAAGANLQDLTEYIALANPVTDSTQTNGCTGVNYNIQLTLPYITTNIQWNLGNGTTPYTDTAPVAAGTIVRDGQTLYIYKYPKNPVSFPSGNYSTIATVLNPTNNTDCGSYDNVELDYNVSDSPVADFGVSDTYAGDSTQFIDKSISSIPLKQWSWDFGDNQTGDLQNPGHVYLKPGDYKVTLTVTNDNGCTSVTDSTIHIILKPIAPGKVTGNISVCAGNDSASPNIEQFTLGGQTLTANITATAPPGFQISFSPSGGYGNNLTLIEKNGTVDTALIYVRAIASSTPGPESGNIVLSSQGEASVNVKVTANINALPTINAVGNQKVENTKLTQPVNFTGTASGYYWVNDTPGIGLPAAGSGNIAPFMAIDTGGSPITATITATPVFAGFAYIANFNSNNVSVVNTATNTVVSTILVGSAPFGVCVSPDGSKVYVTNQGADNISVIDAASNTVVATIPVTAGSLLYAITINADGSLLYVTDSDGNRVFVISTSTNKIVTTIPVGTNPNGLSLSPDGSRLYVTNLNSNTVSVISTATDKVTATVPVGTNPYNLAITPDGSLIYVANLYSGNISVINASNAVIATIPLNAGPYAIAISKDGSKAYVVTRSSNSISVINTQTNTITSTIDVGTDPAGISLSPDGKVLIVANQVSNSVSIINTATDAVVGSVNVGSSPVSIGNFIIPNTGCDGTPVTFTITVTPTPPATITETGSLTALNTTYGTPSSAESFTVSGISITNGIQITAPAGFEISVNGTDFTTMLTIPGTDTIPATEVYVRLAATTPVGNYTGNIVITAKNTTAINLNIPNSTVNFAPLVIKADDKSRPYGAQNPLLTVTYTGFVNNDSNTQLTTQPEISTVANITSAVGQYPITISGATAANYIITFINGVLTISPSPSMINIPNTFTPNGDGINDVWNIKYLNYYPACTVNIFNRYGEKLFTSIGYPIPWDGRYNGNSLPVGTYYYIIDLKIGITPFSGWIAIVK